jgi:hypothetical protein
MSVCGDLWRDDVGDRACCGGARPSPRAVSEAEIAHRQWKVMKSATEVGSIVMLFISLASPVHAQAPPFDPNLPSVKPQALQHLSDNRVRQRIMQESQARYGGRCVCPYETKDLNGRSCKGRHEVITTPPRPICYPGRVTSEMVSDWRRHH